MYIDEAGDDGLHSVAPIDKKGASEWFVLAGVLIRRKYESAVDEWISKIRLQTGQIQGHGLHYRNMSPHFKSKSCKLLSELPVRTFIVASNKKNMRGYFNAKAAAQGNPDWFYNFCTRILIERVSDSCASDSIRHFNVYKKLKIVFSQRENHSYGQTAAYFEKLLRQARSKRTFLKTREIKPQVLDRRLITYAPHTLNGGLQLADIVASAFYQAVDTSNLKNWTPDNAITLMPTMSRHGKIIANQGLVLLPSRHQSANLSSEQKKIFSQCGYEI